MIKIVFPKCVPVQISFSICHPILDTIYTKLELPTYVANVDLKKAFDGVDWTMLCYKVRNLGIGDKLYNPIKYVNCSCYSDT